MKEFGITVNKNGIPNDPRNFIETSGIRIGTAAETTRGLKEKDFKKIANKICNLLEIKMNIDKLREEITYDEGVKYEVYLDHLGLPTFGIGHLVTKNDEEYEKMLDTLYPSNG